MTDILLKNTYFKCPKYFWALIFMQNKKIIFMQNKKLFLCRIKKVLHFYLVCANIFEQKKYAPLAQLDRVIGYETARHIFNELLTT